MRFKEVLYIYYNKLSPADKSKIIPPEKQKDFENYLWSRTTSMARDSIGTTDR